MHTARESVIHPNHLIILAKAFERGEADVIGPFYDALLELGYTTAADVHFGVGGYKRCLPGDHCDVIRAILGGHSLADVEIESIRIKRNKDKFQRLAAKLKTGAHH